MKKIMTIVLSTLLMINSVCTIFAESQIIGTVSFEQSENVLTIISEDSSWKAALAESGSIDIYSGRGRKLVGTIESNNIEYKDSKLTAVVPDVLYTNDYILEYKANGYRNVKPTPQIGYGYEIKGIDRVNIPDSITITDNVEGRLVIEATEDYVKDIDQISVVFNSSGHFVDMESVQYEGNKITADISNFSLVNGTYDIYLFGIKYKNSSTIQAELSNQDTKACPDFDVAINDSGDLVISSSNSDWLDALTSTRTYMDFTIEGRNGVNYFRINNIDGDNTRLVRVGDTVVIEAEKQLAVDGGQIINGIEYDVVFTALGYAGSQPKKITFTNAKKHIPSGTTVNLVGNQIVLKVEDSEDKELINGTVSINFFDNDGKFLNIKYEWNSEDQRFGKISDDGKSLVATISSDSSLQGLVSGTKTEIMNDGYVIAYGSGGESDWLYLTVQDYEVSFNPNGGTGSMTKVVTGGSYKLPSNGFGAPNGMHFLGWKIDGIDKLYFAGETVLITGNTTIKAEWKKDETPSIDPTNKAGEIKNPTNSASNEMKAELSMSANALANAFGLDSDDISAGASAWLETKPIDEEDPEVKQLDRAIALESKGELLKCLQINVFKKVGNETTEKVSETNGSIPISLYIGDAPELIDKAIRGELFIYSIHDGEITDLISGTYNATTKMFTFNADKFSVYGLVYIERETPTPSPSHRYTVPNTGVTA